MTRKKTGVYKECEKIDCSNLFYVKPSHLSFRKYCSYYCAASCKTGWHHSEESKKKIKESNLSNNTRGIPKKLFGHTVPKYRLYRNTVSHRLWREAILKRDDFTCQKQDCEYCNNELGVELHVHHIIKVIDRPDLVFDLNNGIIYCSDYHLKGGLHKKQ